jgi:NAD(P)-dependent dehydrogenase (short-subunit alcohol dehydrogenase family)
MGVLTDKVAVITGAASGIGEGVVRHFVDEGAAVVVADIQDDAGEALAKDLGPRGVFQHTDVTKEQDVAAAVDRAVREFGRIDCMYNNAGGFGARGSILEIDEAGFDFTCALLLKSVFFGMKHAGAAMVAHGGGSILSTASISGLPIGDGPHLYRTFKAAVIQLTKSVALELGESNVRVNSILPGGVATPLVFGAIGAEGADDKAKTGIRKAMAKTQPLPRGGETFDVARAAAWLASDASDYVTGQALTVDGGESLGPLWLKQFVK